MEYVLKSKQRRITELEIDPVTAKMLLEHLHPTKQRPEKKHIVAILSEKMSRGEYRSFCGTPFVIDKNGYLLNGQQRSRAVARSGVTIKDYCVVGADEDDIFAWDCDTSPRSYGDILHMNGFNNANRLAGACNWIYLYKNGRTAGQQQQYKAPLGWVFEFCEQHPDIHQWVSKGATIDRLISPALICGFCWLFAQKSQEEAEVFLDDLKTGAIADRDDPVLALRERIGREKYSIKKTPMNHLAVYLIQAWNARRQGMPKKVFKWNGESFPDIL